MLFGKHLSLKQAVDIYYRVVRVILPVIIILYWSSSALPEETESYPPLPEALEALESDDEVIVRTEEFPSLQGNPCLYVFEPKNLDPNTGFIFYPGGLVDPRAYAPPAYRIAAQGFLTVIVCMPQDLAPYGSNRANKVLRRYDWIEKWAIGGHSVGGSFACKFARQFAYKLDGVILWGSWPSVLFRLDRKDIQAISIYGSNDGYPEEIQEGAKHLPEDAIFVEIQGGNHTQCGYYDTAPDPVQPHDGIAEISREEQQDQMIAATVEFLGEL